MSNDYDSPTRMAGEGSRGALVIIMPAIFVLILLIALVVAYLSARHKRHAQNASTVVAERRLERLENHNKAEPYLDWTSKEKTSGGESSFSMELCVICLEDFTDASQIRVLDCRHVFHQACLDNWFARLNEYCPLCHQAIIPGEKKAPVKERGWSEPLPVAFMI